MHLHMPILWSRERLSPGLGNNTELPSVSLEHVQRLRVDVNVQQLREWLYDSSTWGDIRF